MDGWGGAGFVLLGWFGAHSGGVISESVCLFYFQSLGGAGEEYRKFHLLKMVPIKTKPLAHRRQN